MNSTVSKNHPKGLYLLFAVEMWERFSYYGMRSLLVLYMVKFLMFRTEQAGQIYGIYTGLVYLTPLIGGYLADRYLGARKSILIGGFLMMIGQFMLAFSDMLFFYTALGFLIVGNGFFKPNISTIVGQLYEEHDSRRDGGFTIFYMGINLGAFLSPLICGTLGEKIGFQYGFISAGVGMAIGMAIYLWGQKKFLGQKGGKVCHNSLQKIEDSPKPLTLDEKKKIAVIFILMFFSIFFWASFEQAGSSLTLFADRSIDRIIPFTHWEFPVSYFQSINPLLIIMLAPLFSKLWIDLAYADKEPSTPAKFAIGLFLVAFGFVLMMIASTLAGEHSKVSCFWLLFVYLFHTAGELCISPVGLSVVTKLSPKQFGSLLMGTWFLSSFFANLIGGFFAGSYDSMSKWQFFMMPVLFTGGSAIVLVFLIKRIKNWMGE
jgi:POT family proton-dependent oligopeptide transporter